MGFKVLKLLCLLAALAFVFWQVREYQLGQASRRWRKTRGKVHRAYVEAHEYQTRYGGTQVNYSAKVEYVYQVGSQHFTSTHLSYEPTSGLSEDQANELLDGITDGADVDVYYDPHDFEHAVLVPGTSSGNIFQLVVSIAALAFATWFSFFSHFGE